VFCHVGFYPKSPTSLLYPPSLPFVLIEVRWFPCSPSLFLPMKLKPKRQLSKTFCWDAEFRVWEILTLLRLPASFVSFLAFTFRRWPPSRLSARAHHISLTVDEWSQFSQLHNSVRLLAHKTPQRSDIGSARNGFVYK